MPVIVSSYRDMVAFRPEKLRLIAGEQEDAAEPGTAVFVPAGEARGLKARTRIVALHVVSPPPTDADHVEVAARLKQGDWQ